MTAQRGCVVVCHILCSVIVIVRTPEDVSAASGHSGRGDRYGRNTENGRTAIDGNVCVDGSTKVGHLIN